MGEACSRVEEHKNTGTEMKNEQKSNNSINYTTNNTQYNNISSSNDENSSKSLNDLKQLESFEIPTITEKEFKEVEKKIEEETGFKTYRPSKIKLNKNKQKIRGTYFQYNKGCILYVLLNGGWIDEKFIPDSMKFYKEHNHKEDELNDKNMLRRIMSIIDLAQLWMNIGGKCPYLEISLKEVKKRIFLVLKEYFQNPDTTLMKKIASMSWQNKDYYELIGDINVKCILLREKLNKHPCIKNAIDQNIIKNGDLIKFGRHFIIFDQIIDEGPKKIYSFQDSLSYFFKTFPTPNHNNCECDKEKGFVFAQEDSGLINIDDNDEFEIGILEVIN